MTYRGTERGTMKADTELMKHMNTRGAKVQRARQGDPQRRTCERTRQLISKWREQPARVPAGHSLDGSCQGHCSPVGSGVRWQQHPQDTVDVNTWSK